MAVFAGVAGGFEGAVFEPADHLRAAEADEAAFLDQMAALAQLFEGLRGESTLHGHFMALHDLPTRRIDSLLNAMAGGECVKHHLQMPLRLHRPAHELECHVRLFFLFF